MAERYVRAIQKQLQRGLVYFKLCDDLYRVEGIEVRGSKASLHCKNLEDGEDYEVSFEIERNLLEDLLRFSLKDRSDRVFIISEEMDKPVWFEMSLRELVEGLKSQLAKKNLEKELAPYLNLEEE